jgi:hypothetical protein
MYNYGIYIPAKNWGYVIPGENERYDSGSSDDDIFLFLKRPYIYPHVF